MISNLNPGVRLEELAQFIQGQIQGSGEILVTGIASLESAKPGDLVFVANPKWAEAAKRSQASAFIVAKPLPNENRPQLLTPAPLYAFVCLVRQFFMPPPQPKGLANEIVRGVDVRIGPDASIGPFVTLGDRVQIGARVTLYPGVFLGDDVVIGDDSVLYPQVTVLEGCTIGARVILHSGTVIGSDGFGYVEHEGRHHKIPQLGTAVIEDDVELGANVTVDRATFGQTIIKRGTKVDNQVQIAHNVSIGEDCILVSQVGIAGSTMLGHHVMVGGQAGLVDHLNIGDGVKIAAGSGVSRNIESGHIVAGRPDTEHSTWLRSQPLVSKLPELKAQVKQLESRIQALERQTRPAARSTRRKKK